MGGHWPRTRGGHRVEGQVYGKRNVCEEGGHQGQCGHRVEVATSSGKTVLEKIAERLNKYCYE